jgi:hypothetical protein
MEAKYNNNFVVPEIKVITEIPVDENELKFDFNKSNHFENELKFDFNKSNHFENELKFD